MSELDFGSIRGVASTSFISGSNGIYKSLAEATQRAAKIEEAYMKTKYAEGGIVHIVIGDPLIIYDWEIEV